MNQSFCKKKYSAQSISCQGFSLVEMMVTVLLFSIISAGIYSALLSGMHSMEVTKSRTELQQDLRIGMEKIKSDFRQASNGSIIDVPVDASWYTSVTFRVSQGASEGRQSWPSEIIKYLLSGTDPVELHRQIILNSVIQEDKVVAENISTLKFRRETATPNIMEVSLYGFTTTPRGTSVEANSTFKVLFRN